MYCKARYETSNSKAKNAQIAFHSSSVLRICHLKGVLSKGVTSGLDGLGVFCPQ